MEERLVLAVVLSVMLGWASCCTDSMSFWDLRTQGMKVASKDVATAEKCFLMALSKNESAFDVHHMIGMVYGHEEKWDKAESHLDLSLQYNNTQVKVWKLLDTVVQAQLKQTKKEGALQKLVRIATHISKLQPESGDSKAYLGFRAAQAEMWDLAVSSFKEAHSLKPNDRAILTNLLTVFATKGWVDRALSFYVPLKSEDDTEADEDAVADALMNNAVHYFLMGNDAHWAEGQVEPGLANMHAAFARCPNCHFIRYLLGKFLWMKAGVLSQLQIEGDDSPIQGGLDDPEVLRSQAIEQLCHAMYLRPEMELYEQYLRNISKIHDCARWFDEEDPKVGHLIYSPGTPRASQNTLNLEIRNFQKVLRKYPIYPIDAVVPQAEAWTNENGWCTSRSLSYARILEEITPKIPFPTDSPKLYLIHLGAGDGMTMDQLYDLFDQEEHQGLLVEGNPKLFAKLQDNLPAEEITKVNAYPSPENIVSILKKSAAPIDADLLKVNLHGLECPVLEAMLEAKYFPKVVVITINPVIPPPLRFSLQSSSKKPRTDNSETPFEWDGSPYWGCSLSYASEVMNKHEYTLIQLEWVYAVYVHKRVAEKFANLVHDDASVYYMGFYGRDDRLKCLAFRSAISKGDPFSGAQMSTNFPEMERWIMEPDQKKQAKLVKKYMENVKHSLPYTLKTAPQKQENTKH